MLYSNHSLYKPCGASCRAQALCQAPGKSGMLRVANLENSIVWPLSLQWLLGILWTGKICICSGHRYFMCLPLGPMGLWGFRMYEAHEFPTIFVFKCHIFHLIITSILIGMNSGSSVNRFNTVSPSEVMGTNTYNLFIFLILSNWAWGLVRRDTLVKPSDFLPVKEVI